MYFVKYIISISNDVMYEIVFSIILWCIKSMYPKKSRHSSGIKPKAKD